MSKVAKFFLGTMIVFLIIYLSTFNPNCINPSEEYLLNPPTYSYINHIDAEGLRHFLKIGDSVKFRRHGDIGYSNDFGSHIKYNENGSLEHVQDPNPPYYLQFFIVGYIDESGFGRSKDDKVDFSEVYQFHYVDKPQCFADLSGLELLVGCIFGGCGGLSN